MRAQAEPRIKACGQNWKMEIGSASVVRDGMKWVIARCVYYETNRHQLIEAVAAVKYTSISFRSAVLDQLGPCWYPCCSCRENCPCPWRALVDKLGIFPLNECVVSSHQLYTAFHKWFKSDKSARDALMNGMSSVEVEQFFKVIVSVILLSLLYSPPWWVLKVNRDTQTFTSRYSNTAKLDRWDCCNNRYTSWVPWTQGGEENRKALVRQ